jgi:gamma-glutamyltranspeptidase
LKGYVEAKKRFGNPQLSLMDLLKPTIELCERGFKVTRSLAKTTDSFKTKTKYDKNLRYLCIE